MNTYSEEKIYENYSNEVERMQKCIDELLQENKKYKEVIDKIKHYIEKECRIYGLSMPIDVATHLDNILGILKEVE